MIIWSQSNQNSGDSNIDLAGDLSNDGWGTCRDLDYIVGDTLTPILNLR